MILRTGRLKENMVSRYKIFYMIFATIVAAIILTSCGTQAEMTRVKMMQSKRVKKQTTQHPLQKIQS